jgi:hypothetical protein
VAGERERQRASTKLQPSLDAFMGSVFDRRRAPRLPQFDGWRPGLAGVRRAAASTLIRSAVWDFNAEFSPM